MSDYPNSGTVRKNKYKNPNDPNDKKPDSTGELTATCVHCLQETTYQIAAWQKKGNYGPFVVIKLTEKGEAERRKAERAAAKRNGGTAPKPEPADKPEDDLPF